MQHIYRLQDANVGGVWLSIGKFDGVHLGHQKIISELTAGAHSVGAPAVVLTFDPHPAVVLRGRSDSFYLSMPEEKAELLGNLGIDLVVTHPFNHQVAEMSAAAFMQHLDDHLNLDQLWVGQNFTLGHNREGTVPRLRQIGREIGFSVHEILPVMSDGEVISSSRIRSLIEDGEVEAAASLLGRSFDVRGEVVTGDSRGHQLGFPTANLKIPEERVVPGAGVYASWVTWQGKRYPGVTNVGVRPTFEHQPVAPRVETHLLDFASDLYGQQIQVSFEQRLRGEKRFPDVDALVAQINLDIEKAHKVLV